MKKILLIMGAQGLIIHTIYLFNYMGWPLNDTRESLVSIIGGLVVSIVIMVVGWCGTKVKEG